VLSKLFQFLAGHSTRTVQNFFNQSHPHFNACWRPPSEEDMATNFVQIENDPEIKQRLEARTRASTR